MGGWVSKQPLLSTADEHRLARKCKSLSTAYSKCHKANPNNAKACNNLETSLVMCYAADLCKPESDAHQKCYMSLMNTGRYKGKMDCEETVNAMKLGLKKYKLYPFNI
eukprot:GHRR01010467.1.p1 GENE.GHRR01010467.1~~GHRR01010467.1.p1  ORF type:complete len:108 (+),score=13.84 GHRR01010467.1:237-560(+)